MYWSFFASLAFRFLSKCRGSVLEPVPFTIPPLLSVPSFVDDLPLETSAYVCPAPMSCCHQGGIC